jgi:medium-chain acyl-CoA synthetase
VDKDIEFRCTETGATAFVGDSASVQKFQRVWKNCPTVKNVIQVDEDTRVSETETSIIDFESALQDIDANAIYRGPNVTSSDPALIYFTSGTTGPPKMVQHSHISYPLGLANSMFPTY